MSVVQTFKVLKPLKTGGREYQRGELLPSAENWPFNVQDQRMRTGYIEKATVSREEYEAFLGKLNSEVLAEYAPEAETSPAPEVSPEGEAQIEPTEGADDTVPDLTESDVEDPEVLEEDAGEDEEVSEEEDVENSDTTNKPKKIVRKRRG